MRNECISIALQEYGVTEKKGAAHHPRILMYFSDIGHSWVQEDETAWCSCFANWVAQKAGYIGSGKLDARSWLGVGKSIQNPVLGSIVVFWRERKSSWKGHVGFYIGHSEDRSKVYCLGGNQNNQVNIRSYPAYRVLGYRELDKKPEKSFRIPMAIV